MAVPSIFSVQGIRFTGRRALYNPGHRSLQGPSLCVPAYLSYLGVALSRIQAAELSKTMPDPRHVMRSKSTELLQLAVQQQLLQLGDKVSNHLKP